MSQDSLKLVIALARAHTALFSRIEKKGLAVRRQCETDRRVFYVTLTDAGQDIN